MDVTTNPLTNIPEVTANTSGLPSVSQVSENATPLEEHIANEVLQATTQTSASVDQATATPSRVTKRRQLGPLLDVPAYTESGERIFNARLHDPNIAIPRDLQSLRAFKAAAKRAQKKEDDAEAALVAAAKARAMRTKPVTTEPSITTEPLNEDPPATIPPVTPTRPRTWVISDLMPSISIPRTIRRMIPGITSSHLKFSRPTNAVTNNAGLANDDTTGSTGSNALTANEATRSAAQASRDVEVVDHQTILQAGPMEIYGEILTTGAVQPIEMQQSGRVSPVATAQAIPVEATATTPKYYMTKQQRQREMAEAAKQKIFDDKVKRQVDSQVELEMFTIRRDAQTAADEVAQLKEDLQLERGGKKRKHVSPDSIPNPVGSSYGIDDQYFCYSDDSIEESLIDALLESPSVRASKRVKPSTPNDKSPSEIFGDPSRAAPYHGDMFGDPVSRPFTRDPTPSRNFTVPFGSDSDEGSQTSKDGTPSPTKQDKGKAKDTSMDVISESIPKTTTENKDKGKDSSVKVMPRSILKKVSQFGGPAKDGTNPITQSTEKAGVMSGPATHVKWRPQEISDPRTQYKGNVPEVPVPRTRDNGRAPEVSIPRTHDKENIPEIPGPRIQDKGKASNKSGSGDQGKAKTNHYTDPSAHDNGKARDIPGPSSKDKGKARDTSMDATPRNNSADPRTQPSPPNSSLPPTTYPDALARVRSQALRYTPKLPSGLRTSTRLSSSLIEFTSDMGEEDEDDTVGEEVAGGPKNASLSSAVSADLIRSKTSQEEEEVAAALVAILEDDLPEVQLPECRMDDVAGLFDPEVLAALEANWTDADDEQAKRLSGFFEKLAGAR